MKRMRLMQQIAAFLLVMALPFASASALAQNRNASPTGVLSLSAQASAEVPQDIVHITLFHEQQSDSPSALTATLKQKTGQALRLAKRQSAVSVQTGAFTVYPFTNRDGRLNGWRGRAELLLESRDFAAAAKLAGELTQIMQIGGVRFSLSAQTKRQAQEKLALEAIAAFRRQAKSAAQAFGYGGYTICKVSVSHSGAGFEPQSILRTYAVSPTPQNEVPLEAGKTALTVTVSGSVQMAR